MDNKISIYSQNARGLNCTQKRRDVFQYIRQKNYNIICLQDVHLENKIESYVKNEWGYKFFLAGLTSNERGVMILVNNNFEHDIGRIVADPNGNFLILEITIKGKKITLVNIYGPNEDRPQFYSNLKQNIEEFGNDRAIICGDWNLIIDPDLDCENYKHINNPKVRDVVKEFLEDFDYMDAYRLINDDKKSVYLEKIKPRKETSQTRLFFY